MEDVLSVYAREYDPRFPVVCLDEMLKVLHDTPRGHIKQKPGRPLREDYEYSRQGTANLFVSVEPLVGKRKIRVTDRRTAVDFAHALACISDEDYPDAEKIVLVVDNLNTHDPGSLYECFPPAEARRLNDRFEWHFTPEHGSWLNIAECELSALVRQYLGGRVADRPSLEAAVAVIEQERNDRAKPYAWHFKTDDARIKLRRLYPVAQA
jgi:hypothetical protein